MPQVDFFKADIDYERLEKLWRKAVKSSWLTSGPLVQQFEQGLGSLLATDKVLAVSSCTHATHLALVLSGVGPGDEVLLPANTFVSVFEVINLVGAKAVICDI